MTEILKGSTCPLEEIRKDQLVEQSQEFRTRKFWDKPPLERSQIAAEWLKELKMTHDEITLLLSWEEIHAIDESQDIHMPFTKGNFASIMELYSLNQKK